MQILPAGRFGCRIGNIKTEDFVIHKVDIKTSSRVDFQDITLVVNDIVAKSGVKSGVCYIFVPHTTGRGHGERTR